MIGKSWFRSLLLYALCCPILCKLSMEEKVSRMSKESSANSFVRLTSDKFRTYIETQRNYSVILLLNARDERYGCGICGAIEEEFKKAALSWNKYKHHSNEYIFAILDVDDGRDIFEQMKLDFVPLVKFFPAHRKPTEADILNFQVVGIEAENILKFVSKHCMNIKNIPLYRPINVEQLVWVCSIVLVAFALLFFLHKKFGLLHNRSLWGFICLIYTFVMLSGYMWNQIRSPSQIGKNEDGSLQYFAGDRSYQFVYESYLIAAVYGLTSLIFIVMVESVSKKDKKAFRSTVAVLAVLAFTIVFSVFLSICKMKSGFYPYTLFFN